MLRLQYHTRPEAALCWQWMTSHHRERSDYIIGDISSLESSVAMYGIGPRSLGLASSNVVDIL